MTDPETRAISVDVADLCERLKRVDCSGDELGGDIGTCSYLNPDGPEAATALETLAAENAWLREVLEPFAALARAVDAAVRQHLGVGLDGLLQEAALPVGGKAISNKCTIKLAALSTAASLSPITQVKESGRG